MPGPPSSKRLPSFGGGGGQARFLQRVEKPIEVVSEVLDISMSGLGEGVELNLTESNEVLNENATVVIKRKKKDQSVESDVSDSYAESGDESTEKETEKVRKSKSKAVVSTKKKGDTKKKKRVEEETAIDDDQEDDEMADKDDDVVTVVKKSKTGKIGKSSSSKAKETKSSGAKNSASKSSSDGKRPSSTKAAVSVPSQPSDWSPVNTQFTSALKDLFSDVYGADFLNDSAGSFDTISDAASLPELDAVRLFRHLYVPSLLPPTEQYEKMPCVLAEQPISPCASYQGMALMHNICSKKQPSRSQMSSLHLYFKLVTDMEEMHHVYFSDQLEFSRSSTYLTYFRMQGPGSVLNARLGLFAAMREDQLSSVFARFISNRLGWDSDELSILPYSPTQYLAEKHGYASGEQYVPVSTQQPMQWTEVTPLFLYSEHFVHLWRGLQARTQQVLELERLEQYLVTHSMSLHGLAEKALVIQPEDGADQRLPVSVDIPFSRSFLTLQYTMPAAVTLAVLKAYLQLVVPVFGGGNHTTPGVAVSADISAHIDHPVAMSEEERSGELFCARSSNSNNNKQGNTNQLSAIYPDEVSPAVYIAYHNPYRIHNNPNSNQSTITNVSIHYKPIYAPLGLPVAGHVAAMPLHNRPVVELLLKHWAVERGYGTFASEMFEVNNMAKEVLSFKSLYRRQAEVLREISALESKISEKKDMNCSISPSSQQFLTKQRLVYQLPLSAQRAMFCSFEFPRKLQVPLTVDSVEHTLVVYPMTFGRSRVFRRLHSMATLESPCFLHRDPSSTYSVDTEVPQAKVSVTQLVSRTYLGDEMKNVIQDINPFVIKTSNTSQPVCTIAVFSTIADLLCFDVLEQRYAKTPATCVALANTDYSISNGFNALVEEYEQVPVAKEALFHFKLLCGEDPVQLMRDFLISAHSVRRMEERKTDESQHKTSSSVTSSVVSMSKSSVKSTIKTLSTESFAFKRSSSSISVDAAASYSNLLCSATELGELAQTDAYYLRSRKKCLTAPYANKLSASFRSILTHNLGAYVRLILRSANGKSLMKQLTCALFDAQPISLDDLAKPTERATQATTLPGIIRSNFVMSHPYWDLTAESLRPHIKVVIGHKAAWNVCSTGVLQDFLEREQEHTVDHAYQAQSMQPLDNVKFSPSDLCVVNSASVSSKEWAAGVYASEEDVQIKPGKASLAAGSNLVQNTGGYNYAADWAPVTSTSTLVYDCNRRNSAVPVQHQAVAVRKVGTVVAPDYKQYTGDEGGEEEEEKREDGFEHQFLVETQASGANQVFLGFMSSQRASCHRLFRTYIDGTHAENMHLLKKGFQSRNLVDPYAAQSVRNAVLHPCPTQDDAQHARFSAYNCTSASGLLTVALRHSNELSCRTMVRTTVHPANHHIQIWAHHQDTATLDLSLSWLGPGDFAFHFPGIPVSTDESHPNEGLLDVPLTSNQPHGYVVDCKWLDNAEVAYQGEHFLKHCEQDRHEQTYIPRLGILAALFSDGNIYVVAVPQPAALRSALGILSTTNTVDIPLLSQPHVILRSGNGSPLTSFDISAAPVCPTHHSPPALFLQQPQNTTKPSCVWNCLITAGGLNGFIAQYNLGTQLPSMYMEQQSEQLPLQSTWMSNVTHVHSVVDIVSMAKYSAINAALVHTLRRKQEKVCITTTIPPFLAATDTNFFQVFASCERKLYDFDAPTQSVRSAVLASHSLRMGNGLSEQALTLISSSAQLGDLQVAGETDSNQYTVLIGNGDAVKMCHLKGLRALITVKGDYTVPLAATCSPNDRAFSMGFAIPAHTTRSAFLKLQSSIVPTADSITYSNTAKDGNCLVKFNKVGKYSNTQLPEDLIRYAVTKSATISPAPDLVTAKAQLTEYTSSNIAGSPFGDFKSGTGKTCIALSIDPLTRERWVLSATAFGQVAVSPLPHTSDFLQLLGSSSHILLDTQHGLFSTALSDTRAKFYSEQHGLLEPRLIVRHATAYKSKKLPLLNASTKEGILLHSLDNADAHRLWVQRTLDSDNEPIPERCFMGCMDSCVCYNKAIMLVHGYLNDYTYVSQLATNSNVSNFKVLTAAMFKLNNITIVYK